MENIFVIGNSDYFYFTDITNCIGTELQKVFSEDIISVEFRNALNNIFLQDLVAFNKLNKQKVAWEITYSLEGNGVISVNLGKVSVTYKVENGYISSEGFYISSKDRAFNFNNQTPLEKVFDFMLTIQQYDI